MHSVEWKERCFEPHKDRVIPDRCFCFSKCTYVIFSIFILKVCYPKGHLLGRRIWAGPNKDAGEHWQPNFWLLHPTWPLRHDLTASGLHWVHLFITFFSKWHLFSCPHTFAFAFFYTRRLMTLKQTKSIPEGHLMCWWYKRLCTTVTDQLAFCVCFVSSVHMCEWMTDDDCVGFRVC